MGEVLAGGCKQRDVLTSTSHESSNEPGGTTEVHREKSIKKGNIDEKSFDVLKVCDIHQDLSAPSAYHVQRDE